MVRITDRRVGVAVLSIPVVVIIVTIVLTLLFNTILYTPPSTQVVVRVSDSTTITHEGIQGDIGVTTQTTLRDTRVTLIDENRNNLRTISTGTISETEWFQVNTSVVPRYIFIQFCSADANWNRLYIEGIEIDNGDPDSYVQNRSASLRSDCG